MEGNKDEAERCIELAEQFILEGKRDKAEKFLLKSEKLYSTQKAKDLLDRLQRIKSASTPPPKPPSEEPTVRKRTNTGGKKEDENPGTVQYTKEQLEAVKRIKDCKDYYQILGVSKDATDSEIKKAYKKLALHFHPDKNKTPGAAEAFKAIANAFTVLTDVEKRKQYDMFGSDEEKIRYTRRHETFTHEADVTAEELFNMFFGTAYTYNTPRREPRWRRTDQQAYQTHHNRETNNYGVLMQMFPVLILIALSLMSSLLVSDPVYSLTQNSKFPVLRTTVNLRVPYYVKENFHSTYQGSLRRLEASVEEEYVMNLRASCHRERSYRESLLWKARNYGDNQLYSKAQGVKTPSCDTLHELTMKA